MGPRHRLRFSHGLSQPVWLTVLKTVRMLDGTQSLQVRRPQNHGKPWLAPYLSVPAGIEMRGWLQQTDSDIQVVWDAPQASGRLVTSFLAHAYPAAIVHRMVRKPGVATFIQLHATTAAQRHLGYSLSLRKRLQTLFYQSVPSAVAIPEVFRLTTDALPLASQAAYLLEIAPHSIDEIADHVLQIRRPGLRHPSWISLVEQCLTVQVWTPDTLPKTH